MTLATTIPLADGGNASPTKAKRKAAPRKEATAKTLAKTTKTDAVVALLSRPKGASLDDMMKATGWQAHSVRGFLAGTVKKKLGHALTSEVTDKGRVWRIEAGEAK